MGHLGFHNQTPLRMENFAFALLNHHSKTFFHQLTETEQIVLQFWYEEHICDDMNDPIHFYANSPSTMYTET